MLGRRSEHLALAVHFHTSLFSYKRFINNSSCHTFICTLRDWASDTCTGLSQLGTLQHHVASSEVGTGITRDIHGAQTSSAVPWVLFMQAGNQVSTGAKLYNMFNDNVPFSSSGGRLQLWFDEGQVCLTTTLTCWCAKRVLSVQYKQRRDYILIFLM